MTEDKERKREEEKKKSGVNRVFNSIPAMFYFQATMHLIEPGTLTWTDVDLQRRTGRALGHSLCEF